MSAKFLRTASMAALACVCIAAQVGLWAIGQVFVHAARQADRRLDAEFVDDQGTAITGTVIQAAYREPLGISR